jgi:polysaccharide biosynthesis protein PslG
MNGNFVRPVRSLVVRLVIASAATATICAYSSGLGLPSARPSSAAYVDTASITDSPTTIGIADSDLYGMSEADIDKTLDTLQSIGVQNVRIFVPWAFVEPAQGTYDWSYVDEVVDAAAARNMGVLAEINATPAWASTSGNFPPGSGTPNATDFASFASAVATRYGNDISAYEIWNEPNSVQFSNPIDPVAYAKLLQAAYPAIKAANPNATVIAGAVGATLSFGSWTLDPTTFISQMYAAGAEGYFDALSFHPYNETTEFSAGAWVANSPLTQLNAIYALMAANGDATKQIWITEYGLSTTDVSQQTQANFIQDILNTWQTLTYAGPIFIYTAQDGTSTDPQGTYGIYEADWTPKLAVAVIQQAIDKAIANNPLVVFGQQVAAVLSQAAQSFVNAIVTALTNALASAAANMAAATAAPAAAATTALVKTESVATPSTSSEAAEAPVTNRTRMGWRTEHLAWAAASDTADSTTHDAGSTATDDPKRHNPQHDSGKPSDDGRHFQHQHPTKADGSKSGDSKSGDSKTHDSGHRDHTGHSGHNAASKPAS